MAEWREYERLPSSTKPLVVGWVPSSRNMSMVAEGREKELPGYRLYRMQFVRPLWFGRICGRIFGLIYSGRK